MTLDSLHPLSPPTSHPRLVGMAWSSLQWNLINTGMKAPMCVVAYEALHHLALSTLPAFSLSAHTLTSLLSHTVLPQGLGLSKPICLQRLRHMSPAHRRGEGETAPASCFLSGRLLDVLCYLLSPLDHVLLSLLREALPDHPQPTSAPVLPHTTLPSCHLASCITTWVCA